MNHRIHIVGASGTGKSTLGSRLAEATRLPLYHLDEIARVGGGQGALRSPAERDRDVADILAKPEWIAEGIHLGWTDPLLHQSTLIIWLSDIPIDVARRRVIGRFLRAALVEARQRSGTHRMFRFRDYARQLRGLRSHLRSLSDESGSVEYATAAALSPFSDRVVRISRDGDLEQLIAEILASDELARPDLL